MSPFDAQQAAKRPAFDPDPSADTDEQAVTGNDELDATPASSSSNRRAYRGGTRPLRVLDREERAGQLATTGDPPSAEGPPPPTLPLALPVCASCGCLLYEGTPDPLNPGLQLCPLCALTATCSHQGCPDRGYFTDATGRSWCEGHGWQALFMTLGAEMGFPELHIPSLHTAAAGTLRAIPAGDVGWYTFCRAIPPLGIEMWHAVTAAGFKKIEPKNPAVRARTRRPGLRSLTAVEGTPPPRGAPQGAPQGAPKEQVRP